MKKIIIAVCVLVASVFGELTVPSGAVITKKSETTVPVAIQSISVTKLEAILSTTNSVVGRYFVATMEITDVEGTVHNQVVKISETQAQQIMSATGHDLNTIISDATAAIQEIVNERFGAQ